MERGRISRLSDRLLETSSFEHPPTTVLANFGKSPHNSRLPVDGLTRGPFLIVGRVVLQLETSLSSTPTCANPARRSSHEKGRSQVASSPSTRYFLVGLAGFEPATS